MTNQRSKLDGFLVYNGAAAETSDLPIKAEDMQYWTAFFQHDLHPGKEINMRFQVHPDVQPFGVRIWKQKKKERKTLEIENHTLGDLCGKETATIGEEKYCATSLESMMDFAISKLGKNIRVISSSLLESQEQYTVEEVKKVGERTVMCHRLNFKKVVFYCHEVNATTTYTVPLVTSDGTKAKALTICHHDTRGMDPDALYQILKVKPGTVPVCHFVGNKAVAWVPMGGQLCLE